jgi:hypothetical protein
VTKMQSLKPARKVWVGGSVGAATTILIWAIETIGNTKIPGTVAVAMSTVLTAIVSYLVPPSENDQVVAS